MIRLEILNCYLLGGGDKVEKSNLLQLKFACVFLKKFMHICCRVAKKAVNMSIDRDSGQYCLKPVNTG
jgi:hypothetical protein